MVSYKCRNCNKPFNKKSNYIAHVNKRKKPCVKSPLTIKPQKVITKNECSYCHKVFTTKVKIQLYETYSFPFHTFNYSTKRTTSKRLDKEKRRRI